MLAPLIVAFVVGQAPVSPQALEIASGGRLGVYVLDTGRRRTFGYRSKERFLMCSTYKTFLVAETLERVDASEERLDAAVPYTEKDLVEYSPVTSLHVKEGSMTVQALCAAAMTVSDNTAANLLLARVGGPAEVTRYLRSLGDRTTRLDRNEPSVNVPHGDWDTTTPQAMASTVRKILFGGRLKPSSVALLEGWMRSCTSGLARLRAGFPADWVAEDKTGSGHTEVNDVAIVYPPGRKPIIVVAFYDAPESLAFDQRQEVLKQVGAFVAGWAG